MVNTSMCLIIFARTACRVDEIPGIVEVHRRERAREPQVQISVHVGWEPRYRNLIIGERLPDVYRLAL